MKNLLVIGSLLLCMAPAYAGKAKLEEKIKQDTDDFMIEFIQRMEQESNTRPVDPDTGK